MKVLMIEPHSSGHHGPYLEWMAAGLAERGFGITIATIPESIEHPSFQSLAQSNKEIQIVPVSGLSHETTSHRLSGLMARELSYWRFFKKCYKDLSANVKPDVVFLPYLDYCLYAIGLLGSPFEDRPWVGLAMRPSFHYEEMGVVAPRPALANFKKKLFFRMLRNRYLRSLLTIDEPLADYLLNHAKSDDKVTFFPEPVGWTDLPNRTEARKEFGLPPERKLILVYGAITERKGVVELLRAVASPEFPDSVDVLLAGKLSTKIQNLLNEPWAAALTGRGRLVCLNRFIENSEEPSLFAAADIVWLGYQKHYSSSGVLTQAGAAGRQVIACTEGVIGWQTKRHALGAIVPSTDSQHVAAAIHELFGQYDDQLKSVSTFPRPTTFAGSCDVLADILRSQNDH